MAKRGASKGSCGQFAFEPTAEQRNLVAVLASCGVSQETICLEVKHPSGEVITRPTLRKYFRNELNQGMEIANGRVIATAFKMATVKEVPAIVIFWLKTRCGWKEPAQDVNVGVTYGQLVAAALEKGRDEKAKLTVIEGGKAKAA